MTIVELLVGVALLALVLSIGSRWISGLQKTARNDQNRMSIHQQIGILFNLIRRDAAVQIVGGLIPFTNPPGLDILRLPKNANDATRHYRVRYQTDCQPFPTQEQELLGEIYSDSNRNRIYQNPNTCLTIMNCPAGTRPQVSIVLAGPDAAAYSPTLYPGMAICSSLVNDQVRMTIEAVYVSGKNDSLAAEVHQKVFFLATKSAEELMLLPN